MHLNSATCVYVGIICSVLMNLQKKHGGSSGLSESVAQVQWCLEQPVRTQNHQTPSVRTMKYVWLSFGRPEALFTWKMWGIYMCMMKPSNTYTRSLFKVHDSWQRLQQWAAKAANFISVCLQVVNDACNDTRC
jgi:hypothetical protein